MLTPVSPKTDHDALELGLISSNSRYEMHQQPKPSYYTRPPPLPDSEKETRANLDTIAFELQMSILKFLDAKDMCRLAVVSKHMVSVANDPSLWKSLLLGDYCASFAQRALTRAWYLTCVCVCVCWNCVQICWLKLC